MIGNLWHYAKNGFLLVASRALTWVLRHTRTWQDTVKGARETWTWA